MDMINTSTVMETFDVLYDKNHGGTFNGCLETLYLSLERFIKELVLSEIPNIVFDKPPYPTTGKLFSYLKGSEEKFHVFDNGRVRYNFFLRNGGSIFLRDAQQLLYNLIDSRNEHVHSVNQYSLFYEFQNIAIPIGSEYSLIFNPTQPNHTSKMLIDETCVYNVSQFQIIIQKQQNDPSMDLCEQYHADLILEV